MKYASVVKYLSQCQELESQCQELEEYIQRLRDSLEVTGIRYDENFKCECSNYKDSLVEHVIIKVATSELELSELRHQLLVAKLTIIEYIKTLPNENHRKLLNYIYVDGKSLGQCATEMNYSYQYIKELHLKALQDFDERILLKHTDFKRII